MNKCPAGKAVIVALFLVAFCIRAAAQDVTFEFYFPPIPSAPEIISVTNSSAVGGSPLNVYATITGVGQREVCCNGVCEHECEPYCDFSACGQDDFYSDLDPRVSPNPTCIPNVNDTSGGLNPGVCGGKSGNPKLFYYYNGDPLQGGSTNMVYDSDTGSFTAQVPTTGLDMNDTVSYYIIASDNRGNVIAQVPDADIAPCTTLTSWDSNYQTPSMANCAFMNSHEKCGYFVPGAATCGSTYSMNDPSADTCDENQNPISGTSLDDILGITGGAGKGFQSLPNDVVVCTKIKLGANPPDVGSSSGPVDAYAMIFFNPDIIDPDPYDFHMVNAIAVTYAPEMSGADPNLVKVLWDGDCVTNPNTEDPLGCKLIVGGSEVNELKIGAGNAELKFIAKNALPNGKTLLGSGKNVTKIITITANIQLDGGTPLWMTDFTAGFSIQRKNQVATMGTIGVSPAPPLVPDAVCINGDGVESAGGVCVHGASLASSNSCRLTIFKSPDSSFVDEYRVYHSTSNNASGATLLATIPSNRDGLNKSYTDNITTIDGKRHYYWVSSVNTQDGGYETVQNSWASTRCTVEDQVPPDPPESFACATPYGQEKKCECTWDADAITDPSLRKFKLWRDGGLLSDNIPAALCYKDCFSYTDNFTGLVLGDTYTYEVASVDAGESESPRTSTTCTPEDLKPPARVDSLGMTWMSGELGFNLFWNAGSDSDLAGYNIFKCKNTIPGLSCVSSNQYEAVNLSMIVHEDGGTYSMEDRNFVSPDDEDVEFCYWVQACDNCDTAGTCPSTNKPNCSNFDTLKTYMKCIPQPSGFDSYAPLYPDSLTASSLPQGGACKLEWDRVCEDEYGPFPDCDNPYPDMMGYYIMRAASGGSDCSGVTVDTNPAQNSLGHRVGTESAGSLDFTDSGLTNGTTYCYRVHAFDAANNFSREEPVPAPVPCTPMDITPPAAPVITSVEETEVSCSIGWNAVTDTDTVTYNMYRCDDSPENCVSPASYTVVVPSSEELSENDFTVMTGDSFSYCITATDESENESDLFGGEASPSGASNCVLCRAIYVSYPPSEVGASRSDSPLTYVVWWTNSSMDTGSGSYNIYSCTERDVFHPAFDSRCFLDAEGVATGHKSGAAIEVSSSVTVEDCYFIAVTYKEGIDISESAPAFSGSCILIKEPGPICGDGTCDKDETMTSCPADCFVCDYTCGDGVCNIDAPCDEVLFSSCPADCIVDGPYCGDGICEGNETEGNCSADCGSTGFCAVNPTDSSCSITITLSGLFKKIVVQSCTSDDPECRTGSFKKTEIGHQGIIVELVDPNNQGVVIASRTTNSSGQFDSFNISATSDITPGNTYKIRAKYPAGTFDAPMAKLCENASTVSTDGYCLIDLAEKAIGSADTTVIIPGNKVPAPGGDAFGGPMGDPSGDGSVNLFDISAMKPAFGASPGDICYKAWADLNLDGTVNLFDLTVIKEHIGEQFDRSGGYAPSLSKTADDYGGASNCCKASTCN